MEQEASIPPEASGVPIPPVGPISPGTIPPGVQVAIGFQSGPIPPQLVEKITAEHISQIIQAQENQLKRQHEAALRQIAYRQTDRQNQRDADQRRDRRMAVLAGGVLSFVIVLTWILLHYNQTEVAKILVPSVLTFVSGVAAGMGYQRSRQ